jgi:hypothetical protein
MGPLAAGIVPRWLLQAEIAIKVLDHSVALTGGFFQTLSIKDLYIATGVLDHAGFLQNAGSQGNARPTGSQHLGQEIMGHGERTRVNPILAH